MTIKRVLIETAIEEKILTLLITNDSFCRDIVPIMRLEHFQSEYIRKIAAWAKGYFDEYQKAVYTHIQDIFEFERSEGQLQEAEVSLIGVFLNKLSKKFVEDDVKINLIYVVDEAVRYFKKRGLRVKSEKVQLLLDNDRVDEAEAEMGSYKQIAKETSKWRNPFDEAYVRKMDSPEIKENTTLFRFPGKLGSVCGDFKRGELVGVLGKFKSGKSWFTQEMAILAMSQGYQVAYISLEMTEEELTERFYRRLTGRPEETGEVLYPIFDCEKNQNATCDKSQATNRIRLKYVPDDPLFPAYFSDIRNSYVPCNYCRDIDRFNYNPSVWFISSQKKRFGTNKLIKKLKGFKLMAGCGDIRFIPYSAFSANFDQISRDLDKLYYDEDYLADVIVIDQIRILAPTTKNLDGYQLMDYNWKMAKKMAGDRNALVISPHQTTKSGLKKKSLSSDNIADYVGIFGHVNKLYAINQSPAEKRSKMMRFGVIGSRNNKFDENQQVMLLQNFDVGEVILDSEFVFVKDEKQNNNSEDD